MLKSEKYGKLSYCITSMGFVYGSSGISEIPGFFSIISLITIEMTAYFISFSKNTACFDVGWMEVCNCLERGDQSTAHVENTSHLTV